MNLTGNMPEKNESATTIAILENLHDAIFILSQDGIVEYANKSAGDLLGCRLYEMVGKSFREFVVVDVNDDWFKEALSGSSMEIEAPLCGREYQIPALISFGIIQDGGKHGEHILVSARDIAWRKEMERMLSQKQIMALSRSRFREMGELAINLVHNMGQPLTSIQLKLDLLKKEMNKENLQRDKINRHLDKINELLQGVHKTVENARQFAHQSEDDSLKAINVGHVLKRSLQQLDYEFTEKNISHQSNLPAKGVYILANPLSVQQVIVTLLRKLLRALKESTPADPRIVIDMDIENEAWVRLMFKAPGVRMFDADDLTYTLDLKLVQLMVETVGGDFRWYYNNRDGIIYRILFPLNSGNERDQLRNLIALLHQA